MRQAGGLAALALASVWLPTQPAGQPGLTGVAALTQAYDAILNGDVAYPTRERGMICGDAPREACLTLDAVALWWSIALEPESRALDAPFSRAVDEAIDAAEAWTRREPRRAEAWFYRGATHGARAQWRVLREERLAAARDGARAKQALEEALALDPALHDARFGLGMYRYYADVAPATVRLLRWLFLLPGGDRHAGLADMQEARDLGQLVRGEADYQLHQIYLWYEHRPRDALAIIHSLMARYPASPLFAHREAEIHDVYFHDAAASLAASNSLLARAVVGAVREPALASVRARLNMAQQLDRLGRTSDAVALLRALVDERPARPAGAASRAAAHLARLETRRGVRQP